MKTGPDKDYNKLEGKDTSPSHDFLHISADSP